MTTLNFNPSFHQPVSHPDSKRTEPSRKMTFARGARWLCGALLMIWQLSQLSLPPRALAIAEQTGVASANAAMADDSQDARDSAMKSIKYLAQVMDQYHDRFIVYEDVSSAGNHFHAWGLIADKPALVKISGSSEEFPRVNSATVIRCELQRKAEDPPNYGGFIFMNGTMEGEETSPHPNWGTKPRAGLDLTGATELTFWARGKVGGEKVEFSVGGVGYNGNATSPQSNAPFPDSNPRTHITRTLTNQWQQYRISLAGKDLSYVLGGFAWVAIGNSTTNPNGAVFFLDDIQYELGPAKQKQRLDEPRFIRSFTTLSVQPNIHDGNKGDDIDFVLRNTAFVYDNALALLAFLADGSPDSLRRARLIGDALVYASEHDRKLNDGSLRSAYAAGDISLPPGWAPKGRLGTVPAPGFYDETIQQPMFFETDDARIVDMGNNAWAMIALLALYQHVGNPCYLDTAKRIGNVIRSFRQNTGTYQGFLRGLEEVDDPGKTVRRIGASAEHNLDIYAAFSTMFQVTGEVQWQADAQHASRLVEAMWDPQTECYWAGTENPEKIFKGVCSPPDYAECRIPLDVHSWAVMAIPDTLKLHPQVLACAEQRHRNVHHGLTGFDFNNDKDGVWFEGTAQMGVAYELAGRSANAEFFRKELQRAQQALQQDTRFGNSTGVPAACHNGLTTGFNPEPKDGVERIFHYYYRPHVGATAWNVFAQLKVCSGPQKLDT